MNQVTADTVASTLSHMLTPYLRDPQSPAFWLWAGPDRAVANINPLNLKNQDQVLNDRFAHHLSTALGGVRVLPANSRGVFLQIGYTPVPQKALRSLDLDLDAQPSPIHVPIGDTKAGPLWLSILDMGSVLVGGSRRMGKTRFLHGWIQSLIHGDAIDAWLYDGKNGSEFNRYANKPNVRVIDDLTASVNELLELAHQRSQIFIPVSATNIFEYNEYVPPVNRIRPIVLIVDEAALVPQEAQKPLERLIAWSGAHGIVPVLATQRTGVDQVPTMIKTNLTTRIAFRVPAIQDSRVILDRSGAQDLPNIPGRLVFVWDGALIEAQAYKVELPGGPRITQRDIELAQWSINYFHGRMSINALVNSRNISEWDARQILDRWQSLGWLEGGGQGTSRRLSPGLLALVSQSNFEAQSPSKSSMFDSEETDTSEDVSTETEGANSDV